MPEDRTELLAYYRRTRTDLLTAIDGLSDDVLVEPSLDGWSIKDHLAHLAFWDDLRAAEVERVSAGFDALWQMSSSQDDELNDLSYAVRSRLSLDQARWEFQKSRQRVLQAIESATPRGLERDRYGAAGLVSGHEPEHATWIKRWRAEKGL
jgi:hypothetical protein